MTMLMRLMVLMMRKDDHFSDNGCNDNDDHDEDADLMMIDGCCGGVASRSSIHICSCNAAT